MLKRLQGTTLSLKLRMTFSQPSRLLRLRRNYGDPDAANFLWSEQRSRTQFELDQVFFSSNKFKVHLSDLETE
jgi:hypothetical protein